MPTTFPALPASKLPRLWHWAFVAGTGTFLFVETTLATPLITNQPQSQIVTFGSSAVLNVTASGTPPLIYQWKKAGVNLANKTNATLVLTNVQLIDEGTYSVVVSDFSGSVTSSLATLGTGLSIQWQKTLGGDGDDYASVVKRTTDGGFIIGGHSASGASGNKMSASLGSYDYWVVKLDAEGNKLWDRAFGGIENDYLYSLQPTSDGGYILGGISASSPSGNKTSLNFGGYDYWVVKLNSSGNKEWEKSIGGAGDDLAYDIQQTPDGGFIVGGESESGASGNKTNASFGAFDYWIVRLDSNGNKLWEKVFGGNDNDHFSNLQGSNDGGYILNGNSLSGISGNKTTPISGIYDYWVVKIDANGNKLWERIVESSSTDDYRVVRLDASGEKLWDKSFGGAGMDVLYTLERPSQGSFVLGGYSTSGVSGNKSSVGFGNGDYWMVGLNTNGIQVWDKTIGGAGTDVLSSLQEAHDGGYILAGYSDSAISGNKTTASFGGYDYWLVKLVVTGTTIFIAHPQSQTNSLGAYVTLSVTAKNALGYQWRKNGNTIIGATLSSLNLLNFQPTDVGRYDVLVTGSSDDLVSSNAYLFVSGVETNRPNVSILTPKANQRITNNFNFNMTGTAKDSGLGIAQVLYRLNNGPFVMTVGTINWSAALTLVPGTNRVEVKAIDFGGTESAVLSRVFFEVSLSPFTLTNTGAGTILSTSNVLGTPTNLALLEVGRPYQIQAIPAVENVFSNWTGSAMYTNALLNFVMQSNLTLSANFVSNPLIGRAGSYNGLFYGTNVTHQTAGFFTMKVKTNFIFSGRMIFDGDAISMSGKFNMDGTATKLISRAKLGKPDLTLTLALDFANDTDRAVGNVSGDGWTSLLQADRAVFSETNPVTNYGNKYTMLLPGFDNPTDGPSGYGYGLVTIKTNGFAVLAGETADGMKLGQSVPLSKNGQWPLYVFLYKSTRNYTNWVTLNPAVDSTYYLGSLLGRVTLTNNAPSGKITSIKTGWTNAIYPGGFTNEAMLIGSRYLPPPTGTPAMNIANGTITLTNGNFSAALIGSSVLIKPNNAALVTSDNVIKFSLTPKSGLINGSFQHPENNNAVTAFKGAVLQEQNSGGGHFLGTNQGGLLLLEGD